MSGSLSPVQSLVLKIALIAVYTAFSIIRIEYQRRAKRAGQRTVIEESRKYSIWLSVLICYEVLTFFIYLLAPELLGWASLELYVWLRWLGLALAVASLALFVWVHHHLGSNFSMTLRIVDRHTLTVTGPYRWVRHPMYTAFAVLHIAAFLMTANWFIGITWITGLAAVISLRMKREEAMMLETFGREYEVYMHHTGRLTPSWRSLFSRPPADSR